MSVTLLTQEYRLTFTTAYFVTEAVTQRRSTEKLPRKIGQNAQEDSCEYIPI